MLGIKQNKKEKFSLMNYVLEKGANDNTIQGHYKCKINNRWTKVHLDKKVIHLKTGNQEIIIPYESMTDVTYKEKWWRIRVTVTMKEDKYKLDFASPKKAHECYEKLFYKKISRT